MPCAKLDPHDTHSSCSRMHTARSSGPCCMSCPFQPVQDLHWKWHTPPPPQDFTALHCTLHPLHLVQDLCCVKFPDKCHMQHTFHTSQNRCHHPGPVGADTICSMCPGPARAWNTSQTSRNGHHVQCRSWSTCFSLLGAQWGYGPTPHWQDQFDTPALK